MMDISDKSFQHKEIDAIYQKHWEYINSVVSDSRDEDRLEEQTENVFNMILPPPNITGTLHLGHALNITIQDMIGRYNRMKGKRVTWIPGVDHAGIATQVVVEKQLMKDSKLTRHELGRDEFLKKVWQWKEKNNNTIMKQIKTLCPLINYDLEQFTLSRELYETVTDAFVTLYDANLIYRDLRMVDYCCALKTVISNIEVEEMEIIQPTKYTTPNGIKVDLGHMYNIRYPIDMNNIDIDKKRLLEERHIDSVVVSTTRPETMIGDVAVAVNPSDPRFQGLEGLNLRIPFTTRLIKLIFDEQAKMDMGTGAVKITPSHDPKDWLCYLRNKESYNLPDRIEAIDDNGNMVIPSDCDTEIQYLQGKNRYIFRKMLLKMLEDKDYLEGVINHNTTVRLCSRSKDILEYRLKHQWYVNTDDMSSQALNAVESGELKIIPDPDGLYKETWRRYLSEGRAWCISRQLWWGHRIPAYKIKMIDESRQQSEEEKDDNWIVARNREDAIDKVNKLHPELTHDADYILQQDEDVLDTWFSSGIYPFTIMNGRYFPLDMLETGKDILFFWVARMVMLSFALKKTLPFKTIYLHNVIRDKDGKKMSKSLGNIIDPLDIVYGIDRPSMEARIKDSNLDEKEITRAVQNIKKNFPNGISGYGVDSLRMGLVYYLRQSTDINLDISVFRSAHSLLNKLWNVLNMYKMFEDKTQKENKESESDSSDVLLEIQRYMDIMECRYLRYDLYENYDFAKIYDNINQYVMYNYCPFYIEAIKYFKPTLVLDHFKRSLARILHYLHPIAPNATDKMYESLISEHIKYIDYCDCIYNSDDSNMLVEKLSGVREIIHELNTLGKGSRCKIDIHSKSLEEYIGLIEFITKTKIDLI